MTQYPVQNENFDPMNSYDVYHQISKRIATLGQINEVMIFDVSPWMSSMVFIRITLTTRKLFRV
ncbi:10421_t:CDS:2 [Funneliformis geosporum]|uniref:13741_t:CDS:1 n=1 Tax=Funneliformis geosporum TaxID=1117311 RepID=A0A9W4SH19_9GLOM|nr:13741_t:CDS:2 [Funneliformis geosporum]CAI2169021.1 10421_t:CDS:2 [Funneliformis geosporum]